MNIGNVISEAFKIRLYEKALLKAFSEGEIRGTIHTSLGQELNAVLLAEHLEEEDAVFSNHRGHAHYLALSRNFEGHLKEIRGDKAGINQGLGGSQHISDGRRFFSHGILGGIVPFALGRADSDLGVSAVFLGDGAFGEGIVFEGLNFSKVFNLPVLYIIEDNGLSQSTMTSKVQAGDIRKKIESFNIPCEEIELNSKGKIEELFALYGAFLEQIRAGGGPMAIKINCQRLGPHSKGDDLRPKEELKILWEEDILSKMVSQENLSFQLIEKELDELFKSPVSVPLLPLKNEENKEIGKRDWKPEGKTLSRILNEFLKKVDFLYGEDIEDPYGGAFKITKGLSSNDSKTVKNTPISEACLLGFSFGKAYFSQKPVCCEIMFGDFLSLGMDQINNIISKIPQVYGLKADIPFLIRTPMGGGRGYGATHSQTYARSLVKDGMDLFFLHPWLDQVLRPELLSKPTILLEFKSLYEQGFKDLYEKDYSISLSESFCPDVWIKHSRPDMTIVTWGDGSLLLNDLIKEQYEEEVYFDALCIGHWQGDWVNELSESVSKTQKILVFEQVGRDESLSSEILEKLKLRLKGNFEYISLKANSGPIPNSFELEKEYFVSMERLEKSVDDLLWKN